MTATARASLADATLVKDWYLDVNTGTIATPVWTPVSGIMSFKPETPAVFKDATTFDGGGWASKQKTQGSWKITAKLKRAPQSAALTAYDVGAEKLRTNSRLFGSANSVGIRWYEVNSGGPVTEAWSGTASVEWTESSDGPDDIRVVEVTLEGQGAPVAVSPNPGSV